MNIRSVRSYAQAIPLSKPYTIARETISEATIIFFEIILSNGICGRGAANPDPEVVGETPADTLENLQSDVVAAGLIGKDIRTFLSHINFFRTHFSMSPGTVAAIDIALHDAFGKWIGLPVVDFYGRQHSRMLTSITIGIKNTDETIREAHEYKAQGFRILKVKTGIDADEDAERIAGLHKTFGDHFTIRVDANEGYSAESLQRFLDKTTPYPPELIEQPFHPRMDSVLKQFPVEVRRKLAADESLKDPATAFRLASEALFGIFNIKLMKCGGVQAAFEIANIARQSDIALFWGCNDESNLSITAALHAAFACANTRYLDLDGSFDLLEDSDSHGFAVENGYLSIIPKPGF